MPRCVLITGTDTGVGKTLVTAALARALASEGRSVVAIKPIESGCRGGEVSDEDGAILAAASGQTAPRAALARLLKPVAPALAADVEGVEIDFARILEDVAEYAATAEVTLIEGAGGLLSPLTWTNTALDIALRLRAPVLVVGADRLGTLNHLLLTMRELQAARVPIAGIVMSAAGTADDSTGTNADAIARVSGCGRVFSLPRVDGYETASSLMSPVLQWILD